jgi:hypothetical protein
MVNFSRTPWIASCLKTLPVAILIAGAECRTPEDVAGVATSISLAAPDGGKQLDAHTGDRIPLLVTVKDASGDKIPPPSPLTFISRNTTVAQVDSTGVVTTINPGLTYVLVEMPARGATLADSIPVTIAFVTAAAAGAASNPAGVVGSSPTPAIDEPIS